MDAFSRASPLNLGIAPGSHRQIGQVFRFGSSPGRLGQSQNILVAQLSST